MLILQRKLVKTINFSKLNLVMRVRVTIREIIFTLTPIIDAGKFALFIQPLGAGLAKSLGGVHYFAKITLLINPI